jgi:hypothetical protein
MDLRRRWQRVGFRSGLFRFINDFAKSDAITPRGVLIGHDSLVVRSFELD